VKTWTRRQDLPAGSSRALGWDTPSGPNSSAGTKMSALAFGHTGFTGTSIWVDPERDLFIILLTNRVNPTRENNRIGRVRARVADLTVDALKEPGR
jgi:CubicO group peptidase (beta-lactamase class C family)